MKRKALLKALIAYSTFVLFLLLTVTCNNTETTVDLTTRIIIEIPLTGDWTELPLTNTGLENKMDLKYTSTKELNFTPPWQAVTARVTDDKATWVIYARYPIKAFCLAGKFELIGPGDSIHLTYLPKHPDYPGRGAEKILLWNQIQEMEAQSVTPTKNYLTINSIDDYLHWDQFLNTKLSKSITVLDSSRAKISSPEYDYLKSEVIRNSEFERLSAFQFLQEAYYKKKLGSASLETLCTLWDSTQYRHWGKWLRSQTQYDGPIFALSLFNEMEVKRRLGFDASNDSLKKRDIRHYLFYKSARDSFQGLLRERLMAYILVQQVIPKMNPDSSLRKLIIDDYFNQPGFPEYKKMIKGLGIK